MARFYETTILVDPPAGATSVDPWGIQVLASPPSVDGEPINYEPLVRRLHAQSILRPMAVEGHTNLTAALSVLADPDWNRRWAHVGEFAYSPPEPRNRQSLSIGEFLLHDAPVAAETSPLGSQSIFRLAGEAGAISFLAIAGAPALVIVGTAVGLIVLRGLGAVGGALWRGAEPNVERFGADASARLVDALSKRLNLDATSEPSKGSNEHQSDS